MKVLHSAFSSTYWQIQHSVHFRSSAYPRAVRLGPFRRALFATAIVDTREYQVRAPFLRYLKLMKINVSLRGIAALSLALRTFRFEYLSTDPMTLEEIIQAPEAQGLEGKWPHYILTSGASLSEELRRAVERSLKVEVHNRYGSSEFLNIGFECSERNGFHFDDISLKVEMFAPDSDQLLSEGETGEITITSSV